MKPARIIFLDIDGVLVNRESLGREYKLLIRPHRGPTPLHRDCVSALNRITDATGAGLVISSTWRMFGLAKMREILAEAGITAPVIGITPRLENMRGSIWVSQPRSAEITAWLAEHQGEVEAFVILDDDSDMGALMPHLVKTKFEVGLTTDDARNAIDHLQGWTVRA